MSTYYYFDCYYYYYYFQNDCVFCMHFGLQTSFKLNSRHVINHANNLPVQHRRSKCAMEWDCKYTYRYIKRERERGRKYAQMAQRKSVCEQTAAAFRQPQMLQNGVMWDGSEFETKRHPCNVNDWERSKNKQSTFAMSAFHNTHTHTLHIRYIRIWGRIHAICCVTTKARAINTNAKQVIYFPLTYK